MKEENEVCYSVPMSKVVELCNLLKELEDNQIELINNHRDGYSDKDVKKYKIVVREYEKELSIIKDNIEYLKSIGGEPF